LLKKGTRLCLAQVVAHARAHRVLPTGHDPARAGT
jgi:hypothetical protein